MQNPLYQATCIANPNTMRKMVLKGDCSAERSREIIAPLSPKLLSSSLINKMINELAEYQIQRNECLWSDMKDKEVLENAIEFWSERNSLPLHSGFSILVVEQMRKYWCSLLRAYFCVYSVRRLISM